MLASISNTISKSTNASSVGANTVNDPSPARVDANPASSSAANNTVKLPFASAVAAMLSNGRITSSITWITPLVVNISVMMISTPLIYAFSSITVNSTSLPCNVSIVNGAFETTSPE